MKVPLVAVCLSMRMGTGRIYYADRTTLFTIGKLKTCAECHAKAREDDHLFRVWDLPK